MIGKKVTNGHKISANELMYEISHDQVVCSNLIILLKVCFSSVNMLFLLLVLFGMISVDGANVTLEDLENFLSICECETVPKCVVDPFKKVGFQAS